MGKIALFTIVILILVLAACSKKDSGSQNQPTAQNNLLTNKVTSDLALKSALNIFSVKRNSGEDLENGPCLGWVAPDWVADIAHNPRQPQDDKPENQCVDFLEGRAHHFVELDPEGKLIRSY